MANNSSKIKKNKFTIILTAAFIVSLAVFLISSLYTNSTLDDFRSANYSASMPFHPLNNKFEDAYVLHTYIGRIESFTISSSGINVTISSTSALIGEGSDITIGQETFSFPVPNPEDVIVFDITNNSELDSYEQALQQNYLISATLARNLRTGQTELTQLLIASYE